MDLCCSKDFGPSNGRVKEPVLRRARVINKITSFEGPMILRVEIQRRIFPWIHHIFVASQNRQLSGGKGCVSFRIHGCGHALGERSHRRGEPLAFSVWGWDNRFK